MRRRLAAIATATVLLGSAQAAQAVTFKGADGLAVTSAKRLDSRLIAVTVTTKAVRATLNVRILLPTGYAANRTKRYPVVYLLHGSFTRAARASASLTSVSSTPT